MIKKKVLAISGSTRKTSTNNSLIKAIGELTSETLEIIVYDRIEDLPQFNPDRDGTEVAIEVSEFRRKLDKSDGVIICTPEYAHGVPGSLKNAIDWTISSSNFPHKPTVLITASTGGNYGHRSLLETLNAIEAENINNLQMVIPFAKTKIDMENKIIDDKLLGDLNQLIGDFIDTMNKRKVKFAD